jgi:hypothetical protein
MKKKGKRPGGKPGNKNAEKWTEEKALDLAKDLFRWMDNNEFHLFFNEFLVVEKGLDDSTIEYLQNKFKSFSEQIKKAKRKQEFKILNGGLDGRFNAAITCFSLKNHHKYTDKQEVDLTSKGDKIEGVRTLTINVLGSDKSPLLQAENLALPGKTKEIKP